MKRIGCTYVNLKVDEIDDDRLNYLENILFNIGIAKGVNVSACVRDTDNTGRAGIKKLIEKMKTKPFQVLLIDEIGQLGNDEYATMLISLLQEHSVQVLTSHGTLELPDSKKE